MLYIKCRFTRLNFKYLYKPRNYMKYYILGRFFSNNLHEENSEIFYCLYDIISSADLLKF